MNIMKIKKKNLSNNKKPNRKLRMYKINKQNKTKYKATKTKNKNDNLRIFFILICNI